ncbi:hypothetical protein D6C90_10144 [Aureobasidium pullulans]|uniref:Uncharacterized protein n=1 Tax=Aureobasidium pullulans TaxID=5580 RepID=A0A4S9SUQ5_AURPU|nr:hypothetical protein D6C90_10144 [Aureobasidium pullulans]
MAAPTATTETVPPEPEFRRSRRLQNLPPHHDVRVQEQTLNGVTIERHVLYDNERKNVIRPYAEKALNVNLENLHPGRIIKVVDAYPQTNLEVHPRDRDIGHTKLAGAIGAKFRYMIVVWRTFNGVAAVPLYTLKEAQMHEDRINEFVSITTNATWQGNTPWAGMPLLMKTNQAYQLEPNCYADLSRPHWVSKFEKIIDDVGHIDGGEFSKLIDLLEVKEMEYRIGALDRFSTATLTELYEPQEAHVPKPKVRHRDDKTARMEKIRFTRV